MQLGELVEVLALHPEIDVLAKELSKKREKHFLLSNLHASAQSIMLYEVMRREEAYPQPVCSMNVHSGHSIEPKALHPKGKGV
jgi:hypothetical protein